LYDQRMGAGLRQLARLARLLVHERLVYAEPSPDGLFAVTAGEDSARVWEIATGKELWRFPPEGDKKDKGWVNHAAFSPDGQRVMIARGEKGQGTGDAQLRNARTGALIATFKHDGAVLYAAFNHDGSRLLTASER